MPHFIYQKSWSYSGQMFAAIDFSYAWGRYNNDKGQPRTDGAGILMQVYVITDEEAKLSIDELTAKYPYTGAAPVRPPPKPVDPVADLTPDDIIRVFKAGLEQPNG